MWASSSSGAEDGTLKSTLALIVALAAVVLFAPVARADGVDATHPYRDAVRPTADGFVVTPADDDGDDDDDEDQDEQSGDDGDDEDDEGEDEDEESSDDDAGNPPGSTNPPEQGPTTSATPGARGFWLGLLIIALTAIAATTFVVLRRRMTQNR